MKTLTESAWPLCALSEAPASLRASASCYRRAENIFVVAIVVTELEFRDVKREIFAAHIVECADNAALNQRPETFDVLCVNGADNILAFVVIDGLVWEFRAKIVVAYGR